MTTSCESLSIYNDLNPTFSKQKALIELDSRLTQVKNVCSIIIFNYLTLIIIIYYYYYRKYLQDNYI
jgi:hypothetical protein